MMLNLAYPGVANGRIPASQLVQAAGGIPGDLLERTTAACWARWRELVHADTGVWLQLDHSDAIPPAYRDLAGQQAAYDRYKRGGAVASYPGTSNHGWARAVDVTGFETRADVWASMNAHAAECSMSNATGAASRERWHWECTATPGTATAAGSVATPIPTRPTAHPALAIREEDDMPTPIYAKGDRDTAIYALYQNAGDGNSQTGAQGGVYFARRRVEPAEWSVVTAFKAQAGHFPDSDQKDVLTIAQDEFDTIAKVVGSL